MTEQTLTWMPSSPKEIDNANVNCKLLPQEDKEGQLQALNLDQIFKHKRNTINYSPSFNAAFLNQLVNPSSVSNSKFGAKLQPNITLGQLSSQQATSPVSNDKSVKPSITSPKIHQSSSAKNYRRASQISNQSRLKAQEMYNSSNLEDLTRVILKNQEEYQKKMRKN